MADQTDAAAVALFNMLKPIFDEYMERHDAEMIDQMKKFSSPNPEQLLTAREAYEMITRNKDAAASSVSNYMNNLVRSKKLHKIQSGRYPLYKLGDIQEYIDQHRVTGRVI